MRDFVTLKALTTRSLKIFLRDKASVFFSVLAPLLTIMIYILFWRENQLNGILSYFPEGVEMSKDWVYGLIDAWMLSGVVSIACFTVAFSANSTMIVDKKYGFMNDVFASPVKPWVLKFSYFVSNFATTGCIVFVAFAASLAYLGITGNWFLSISDVLLIALSIVLGSLTSTLFTVFVCDFLKTPSQHSALVGVLSAIIGFIMGVYVPHSILPDFVGVIACLFPGTYPAFMIRYFFMRGALAEAGAAISGLDEILAEVYSVNRMEFFGTIADVKTASIVVVCTIAGLLVLNFLISFVKKKKSV